ncbi:MAG: isoprenyl transferase, partial [Staphylococcus epidermidis]|nr:isoprenyl transferase [Staphylococcus epidermidis]
MFKKLRNNNKSESNQFNNLDLHNIPEHVA